MASIKILDSVSAEIFTANPQATAGFAKYLKGTAAQLVAGIDLAGQFKRELALVSPGDGGFNLTWAGDVPLGADGVSLKLAGGTAATVSVFNRTGMLLLEDPSGGGPLTVKSGQAFVALALRPTLTATTGTKVGQLSFGFEAGGEAQWRFFEPFDLMGPATTLAAACKSLLESSVFPNSVEDLRALSDRRPGTIASVSGDGHLQIGCSVDVAAAINPLASLNTVGKLGTLAVGGGASATVGVTATVSGGFEVRTQVLGPRRVRLSYHKVAARDLVVSLDASAGPSVTLGERDLLGLMFGRPAGASGPTVESLVAAGISAAQLKRITDALSKGMSRKVELAVAASFSALKQDEAAFCYDIDVAALDATGAAAVDKALSGDLSTLTRLEPELATHGVTLVRSRTEALRQRTVRWRLNVVGLVNILSMTELAAKATVVHDEESGEVVITDEATRNSVGAVTTPKDLRKLLYQSLLLTVTYKAGQLDQNTSVTAAQSYFKMDHDVNRHEMSDFLDAVAAVGLITQDDIETRLGSVDDFGRGSLLIDVEYDQAACEQMFLDDDKKARTRDFYDDVGKLALRNLVQPDDVDAYRRVPLENGALWHRMRNNVSSDFRTILPPPITSGSEEAQRLHVAIVTADYSMIVWWAGAMATAAARIEEMRAFLAANPGVVSDDGNKPFAERRQAISKAMMEVVRKSPSTFGGDPWGLVALLYASKRSATVSVAVVSPGLTAFLPE